MGLCKMGVEELRSIQAEYLDKPQWVEAIRLQPFNELVRRLEESQKELAKANGWLKHYRKAEPEQYTELRKRLDRYDRRSESGESLGDALDMADELERAKLVSDGCICHGNWRLIINESEPFFGKKFMSGEYEYIFLGVLHGEDDYYYVMWNTNPKEPSIRRYELLTCVGDLAGHGFNLKDQT